MKQQANRIEALDAFRGIASTLIMLTHFILYVPEVFQVENLSLIYSWLSWKLPYFFVLSGFVLTLSYMRSRERDAASGGLGGSHTYRNFIINRIFRIYPLFMLTTIIVFLTKVAFGAGCDIEGASRFFNITWRMSPTLLELVHSLTLVGLSDTWAYNGPAWTLVFEMRYAILFPLFLYLFRKSWLSILLFAALSFVAGNISATLERVDLFYTPDYQLSNLCSMANFLMYYASGIALALNRERLSNLYKSLSKVGVAAFVAVSIIFMLSPKWIAFVTPAAVSSFASDFVIMVGVVMWVVVLTNNKSIANIFTHNALVTLGRSSFSIYMWHTPIFILNYMLLREYLSIWIIIAISLVATLIVARLSFRFIEQPCIALSHRITKK
ncbi:MAG: acyltransferase [Rikenellaceae bacterium]